MNIFCDELKIMGTFFILAIKNLKKQNITSQNKWICDNVYEKKAELSVCLNVHCNICENLNKIILFFFTYLKFVHQYATRSSSHGGQIKQT